MSLNKFKRNSSLSQKIEEIISSFDLTNKCILPVGPLNKQFQTRRLEQIINIFYTTFRISNREKPCVWD